MSYKNGKSITAGFQYVNLNTLSLSWKAGAKVDLFTIQSKLIILFFR